MSEKFDKILTEAPHLCPCHGPCPSLAVANVGGEYQGGGEVFDVLAAFEAAKTELP